MVHVGLDLHKHYSQVAVLEETGKIWQRRLSHAGMEVEEFFRDLPRAQVAIEATGTWWWLVDLLESLGHEAVLSHPKRTKAIASARLKTDRVDAGGLAAHGVDSPGSGSRGKGVVSAPFGIGVAAGEGEESSDRDAVEAESLSDEGSVLVHEERRGGVTELGAVSDG